MFYTEGMPQPDAHSSVAPCALSEHPIWVQSIVKWLLSNEQQLEPFKKMQITFNRADDGVSAEWSVRGIKLPQSQ